MSDENLRQRLGRYAAMQKSFYDWLGAEHPVAVVGHYDFHENFPYETYLLFEYGDVRKPIFPDFSQRRAFDIGCGEGRMVRRMRSFFGQVDGADISQAMVEHARASTPGSSFWVTDGLSAGDAPSAAYDFAYCTISLQHICVFTTRDLIVQDVRRILKPDGKATFQMLFSREYPFLPLGPPREHDGGVSQPFIRDRERVGWFEDRTDATSTNSGCDALIGDVDLDAVRTYFQQYFARVEFWFADISVGRDWGDQRPAALPETHPNSHVSNLYWGTNYIFIHCDGVKS